MHIYICIICLFRKCRWPGTRTQIDNLILRRLAVFPHTFNTNSNAFVWFSLADGPLFFFFFFCTLMLVCINKKVGSKRISAADNAVTAAVLFVYARLQLARFSIFFLFFYSSFFLIFIYYFSFIFFFFFIS